MTLNFFFNLLSQSISDYDIEKNVEILLVNIVVIDYNINLKKIYNDKRVTPQNPGVR